MDIFIKSFNRPFYLDRCISSINKYVSGDFRIKVLDDGTPEQYLDKIRKKHPNVEILLSDNYEKKTKAIEENLISGKAVNGFEIPTKFWYDNVKNASEYVVVTEDDVWFTNAININELSNQAKTLDINLIKLGWLGNESERNDLIIDSISDNLESAQPKPLPYFPKKLMEAFFYNQYKFFTILYKLGQVDNLTQRKYWALNSILMGFYKKEYWLEIWKNMDGKVDEKRQLINASLFYKKNKNNPNFISKLKLEAMKTTFQSSATNSYHEYGFDFDVNRFNHLINEAWLKDEFDSMENFPKDFSIEYFKRFISEKINFKEFQKWANRFRKQYENMGCKTE
ncbi:glycosyltransferase family 2 protein [Epilithonimonas vandammei]|uniref:Glycosyltransferase family 2 protein n=1 Tax=Epilithonimonas vandammei TaxID=2487072 RepID=A0A3G8ZMW2_9FLAO|nr:glycosyltransferase family 2 protein [Epilithonimonas vandammei]AZI55864.1 glycosyltransferase family 2 protein [Epilithonimonas vandammei]